MSYDHYDKLSLLLPMSGVDNGTVFTDYSPVPKTVARVGAVTSTAESKFYGSSGRFNRASGHRLDLFGFPAHGAGDFTWEMWVRPDTVDAVMGFCGFSDLSSNNNRFTLYMNADGILVLATQLGTGTGEFQGGVGPLVAGTWQHVALSRQSGVCRMFVNGDLLSTFTQDRSFTFTTFRVGYHYALGADQYLNGHIQDLRVTHGHARYTENFTPPARLVGEISGTITDDTGAAAIRKIVAFPRAYPIRTFTTDSAADGTYTLQVPAATEHSRIVLDDAAGHLYNDLIDRVIPE